MNQKEVGKMIDWGTLLSSVGTSTVACGVLGWLCREWISARLRKSIQYEYDVKLEGFKAGYQKVLDENRITFSWWHDEQAKALQEIYAIIVECQKKYYDYFEIENSDTSKLITEAKKTRKFYSECYFKYKKYQIFIPDKILGEISNIFDTLNSIVITKRGKGFSDQDRIAELQKVNWYNEQRFENLLSSIRKTFIQILHPVTNGNNNIGDE